MSAPTIYRSTDASAPVLSGTVGSLVALLDACLVNGYGSKAAAGWTKPFTGTNGAAFRQGGSGFYWNIDDNAPNATALAREARTRGYETMTALATGTGLFPTTTQSATIGQIVHKSATADATARAWVVAADNRTCYLFIVSGDTAGVYQGFGFGDFYSYLAGDAYKCFVGGHPTENAGANNGFGLLTVTYNSSGAHVFVARASTQAGGAVFAQRIGDVWIQAQSGSSILAGGIPFPNPATGGLHIAPIRVGEMGTLNATTALTCLRGELRGLYHQGHPAASFADGDSFDGVGEFAGQSFLLLKSAVSGGVWTLNTSDWPRSP